MIYGIDRARPNPPRGIAAIAGMGIMDDLCQRGIEDRFWSPQHLGSRVSHWPPKHGRSQKSFKRQRCHAPLDSISGNSANFRTVGLTSRSKSA